MNKKIKLTNSSFPYPIFQILNSNRRGQLMLTAMLILGGAMIGASIIAGFLVTRNIRQSTLATESAKAIFSADAGVDYMTYRCFKDLECLNFTETCNSCDGSCGDPFPNGSCYIVSYTKDASGLFNQFVSTGYSNYANKFVARTLYVSFQ